MSQMSCPRGKIGILLCMNGDRSRAQHSGRILASSLTRLGAITKRTAHLSLQVAFPQQAVNLYALRTQKPAALSSCKGASGTWTTGAFEEKVLANGCFALVVRAPARSATRKG